MRKLFLATLAFCIVCTANAQQKKTIGAKTSTTQTKISKPKQVEMITSFGTIILQLSDSTPLHRDNFIKLVKSGFYDSLLFHRVIESFMIQGGDPTSKHAPDSVMLGSGEGPGDRIPAEMKTFLFHKKGALAAARDNNPQMASSNCQFYIVHGKTFTDVELNMMECRVRNTNPAFAYTDYQRKIYKTLGGAPFLDQNYTVFGEVIKGLDVIDKIATTPKDANDRPLKNVFMKMRLLN